jgi:hypothetical protein
LVAAFHGFDELVAALYGYVPEVVGGEDAGCEVGPGGKGAEDKLVLKSRAMSSRMLRSRGRIMPAARTIEKARACMVGWDRYVLNRVRVQERW